MVLRYKPRPQILHSALLLFSVHLAAILCRGNADTVRNLLVGNNFTVNKGIADVYCGRANVCNCQVGIGDCYGENAQVLICDISIGKCYGGKARTVHCGASSDDCHGGDAGTVHCEGSDNCYCERSDNCIATSQTDKISCMTADFCDCRAMDIDPPFDQCCYDKTTPLYDPQRSSASPQKTKNGCCDKNCGGQNNPSSMNAGLTVGITLGSTLGVAFIVFLVIGIVMLQRASAQRRANEPTSIGEGFDTSARDANEQAVPVASPVAPPAVAIAIPLQEQQQQGYVAPVLSVQPPKADAFDHEKPSS